MNFNFFGLSTLFTSLTSFSSIYLLCKPQDYSVQQCNNTTIVSLLSFDNDPTYTSFFPQQQRDSEIQLGI